MEERSKPENATRPAYKPPEVVRVSLRPEEAVLGHCKVPGVAGPVSSGCGVPAHLRCNTPGS
jgi:hypothetical protein